MSFLAKTGEWFQMGIGNDKKISNLKTYQQILHEIGGFALPALLTLAFSYKKDRMGSTKTILVRLG